MPVVDVNCFHLSSLSCGLFHQLKGWPVNPAGPCHTARQSVPFVLLKDDTAAPKWLLPGKVDVCH